MSKALTLYAVQPHGTLGDNAPLMLYTRLSEMLYFADFIADPENVIELHSMRIAAKRLRYTLEIFAPAYAESQEAYAGIIAHIKLCQEQIGDIHDCDVRVVQIREFLNQNIVKKPEIRIGLANLIDRETQSRERLYNEFLSSWNGLFAGNSFEKKFVELVFGARFRSSLQTANQSHIISQTASAAKS